MDLSTGGLLSAHSVWKLDKIVRVREQNKSLENVLNPRTIINFKLTGALMDCACSIPDFARYLTFKL